MEDTKRKNQMMEEEAHTIVERWKIKVLMI